MTLSSLRHYFSALLTITLLAGCANSKIANTDILSQQAKQLASQSDLSPQAAILASAKDIEQSRQDELHFFAPLHYGAAQEALTEAQSLLNSKADNALVLEQTFKVSSLLKSAYTNKTTVLSALEKSLAHKQVLEELGSPEVLPDAFQDTVDDLKDLIKEIEGGFLDKAAKGQADLLSAMTDVEINTLKKQHLSQAESMLDKADSVDADDFAETTFEQAEQTLESATKFIEKNYSDRDGVRKTGLEALYAASHAYFIAKESAELIELKPSDAEKKALYFESLLARINKSVGVENLSTMSLYDQSVRLAEEIETAFKRTEANETNDVIQPAASTETVQLEAMPETIVLETRPIADDSSEENIEPSSADSTMENTPESASDETPELLDDAEEEQTEAPASETPEAAESSDQPQASTSE
ncbi:MAG: hypothetical protein ACMZ64_11260 [Oleiphilus sp.]